MTPTKNDDKEIFLKKLNRFLKKCYAYDPYILSYDISEYAKEYSEILTNTEKKYPNVYKTIINKASKIMNNGYLSDDFLDLAILFQAMDRVNKYNTHHIVDVDSMIAKLYCLANTEGFSMDFDVLSTKRDVVQFKKDINNMIKKYPDISGDIIGLISDAIDHVYSVLIDSFDNKHKQIIEKESYVICDMFTLIELIKK